jgi:hypothetical protein
LRDLALLGMRGNFRGFRQQRGVFRAEHLAQNRTAASTCD